jgi:hypothetical protein
MTRKSRIDKPKEEPEVLKQPGQCSDATLKNDTNNGMGGEYRLRAQALLVAIIETAIKDAMKHARAVAKGTRASSASDERAYNWFWSEAFNHWCELVDWDPNAYHFIALRKKLQAMARGEKTTTLRERGKYRNRRAVEAQV